AARRARPPSTKVKTKFSVCREFENRLSYAVVGPAGGQLRMRAMGLDAIPLESLDYRSEAEALGRLYFRERALSSSTRSTLREVSRLRAPFCASVIRPVPFNSVRALSTAPNAMFTTGGVWPTAIRAAFMASAVAGKFALPITAISGFLIMSAAFT